VGIVGVLRVCYGSCMCGFRILRFCCVHIFLLVYLLCKQCACRVNVGSMLRMCSENVLYVLCLVVYVGCVYFECVCQVCVVITLCV